jgi:hypothetical protein
MNTIPKTSTTLPVSKTGKNTTATCVPIEAANKGSKENRKDRNMESKTAETRASEMTKKK